MLNNFKEAIKKKKISFIVKSSFININKLKFLQINNLISGYYKHSKKKKFLLVFINYNFNFKTTILNLSKFSKSLSIKSIKNLDLKNFYSNFIINITINKKRLKQKIKFR